MIYSIRFERVCPLILLMALLSVDATIFAQSDVRKPEKNSHVSDETGTLARQTITELDTLCREVRRIHGADMVIVIVRNSRGVGYEKFANDLFTLWGVGEKHKDNGVMVFVSKADRSARIVLGDGIDTPGQQAMTQEIFERVMVPRFRAGKFDQGVYEATYQVAEQILGAQDLKSPRQLSNSKNETEKETERNQEKQTEEKSSAINNPTLAVPSDRRDNNRSQSVRQPSSPFDAPIHTPEQPSNFREKQNKNRSSAPTVAFVLVAIVAIVFLMVAGIRYLLRFRTRLCAFCQEEMSLLDEHEDDEYLDKSELMEERLGSVRYDVWACLACENAVKVRYGVFFTRFSNCPQCQRKTKSKVERTLQAATKRRGGIVEVTEQCQNCSYVNRYTYDTPQIRDDDDDSHYGGSSRRSRFGSHRSRSRSTSHRSRSRRSSGSSSRGRRFGGGRTSGGGGGGTW